MKIIDAHAHVAQYVAGFTSRGELRAAGAGTAQYASGEKFLMFPPEMGDTGVSPESLLKVMDENGVEKAVLLQGNFLGYQNEYTFEAAKKYPERFAKVASYDPFCVKAEDVKRRLFSELGFKAVKFELSNGSGLMVNRTFDLDGEVMNGCYLHALENNLTVVMDIGRPRNPCWQIDALAKVVRKYPDVTFVLCHLLAPQRQDKQLLKQALEKLVRQNVYFDISSLAQNQKPEIYPYPTAAEHLKCAKSTVGADKIMFGTDMPCNLARDSYAHLKDYILESGVFTVSELEKVFYDTAQKIYFEK